MPKAHFSRAAAKEIAETFEGLHMSLSWAFKSTQDPILRAQYEEARGYTPEEGIKKALGRIDSYKMHFESLAKVDNGDAKKPGR